MKRNKAGSFKVIEGLHGYRFSLQAGKYNYCTPKQDLNTLLKYTSVEFAIIKDGDFVLEFDDYLKQVLKVVIDNGQIVEGGMVHGWVSMKYLIEIFNL